MRPHEAQQLIWRGKYAHVWYQTCCYFYRTQPLFLSGFETLADERVAHHVVLFGCRHPGKQADVFNCGEMERGSSDRGKGKFGKAYLPCGRRGGAPTILVRRLKISRD